ncbi:tetratricopeptide repeat protein [Photobacterium carnosum]|uniref:tetratricopeptide repeat protein n=1 Tax=Photobacterium carnosum TaxID=2023717 RepID=UPI001E4B7F71|nr:tetratricopeptide repeat protein [Photobacterium carnosum]MCD9540902.1 tetratricopeptide repeat protein [Photobacterium carnosum]
MNNPSQKKNEKEVQLQVVESKESSLQTWSLKGFLHEVKRIENDMKDRRFAFILGAGASINSEIKGATALAQEWMEIIYYRLHLPKDSHFEKWLINNPLGLDNWEPENLAKHYPQIFERCFAGDHDSGYAALEKAIAEGKPSLGYAILAWILSETRHKMVITTNFDNLVADAVSIYGGEYPHVIGHESLASYAKPMSRRPIVAKIHRDLLTNPHNTSAGTATLSDSWKKTLKNIFKFYTPVFIGYGGNDGSLMDFLQSLDPKDISGRPFWCYHSPSGEPNPTIKELVSKQHGVLIPIDDFDEFMLQMGEAIGFDRTNLINAIKTNSDQIINQLQEQMLLLNSKTENDEIKGILKPQNDEKQNWNWIDWVLKAEEQTDNKEREQLWKKAIETLPKSHQLLSHYAKFLAAQERFDEAETYFIRTIKVDTKNESSLESYATFLQERQRFDEAETYFLRSIEVDQNAYYLRRYATFLQEQQRFDEAETYFLRSIEVNPKYGCSLESYATFLQERQRFDEAEIYFLRSIEVDQNAYYLRRYATFLQEQQRFDEAETYFLRSIEVDSKYVYSLGGYAMLLQNLQRFDEAETYFLRAIEVNSDITYYLGCYATFLQEQQRFDEAETIIDQALIIKPSNKLYLIIQQQIQRAQLEHNH